MIVRTPAAARSMFTGGITAVGDGNHNHLAWGATGLSILALTAYSASYLWSRTWDEEAYAHGPVVLAIIAWLVYKQPLPPIRAPGFGEQLAAWPLLLVGLVLYVLGRSQNLPVLDVGGLPLVACGLLLLVSGRDALRAYAFPLAFSLFLVPIPTPILEIITGPMRHVVSHSTELLLYIAGYPVGRSGVVLTIGQYQLLVAEACSGLNSLLSLSTMALLYVYLMRYRDGWRNFLLLMSILPIAFVANLARVVFLVLLTYHAGDEAGQGFMHGFAGMFLFLFALGLLFLFDRLLGWVSALGKGRSAS